MRRFHPSLLFGCILSSYYIVHFSFFPSAAVAYFYSRVGGVVAGGRETTWCAYCTTCAVSTGYRTTALPSIGLIL